MKQLLLIILFPVFLFGQTQIGIDIDGEASVDQSGWSVSLSSDGSILAVGAVGNDANGNQSGHVRVFEYVAGSWVQVGSDIDGEAAGDTSGYSVALSSDGSIVAIGARNNSNANGSQSGHVRVYRYAAGAWTQIGSDIDGEAAEDHSGFSVSLSSSGNIVAIGALDNDGNGINSGHVRIYQNISGVWTQIGSDIDGAGAYNYAGTSVSLSSDGNTVAVGSPSNSDNGSASGHVRIFKNQLGTWVQKGSTIVGEAELDKSGYGISLSSDGSVVAIGAIWNDGNGVDSGHVRVYEYISGVWTQIGSDIDGEAAEDVMGGREAVSLSSDGRILAVGAIRNDGNGAESGHVKVFKNSAGVWTQVGINIEGEAIQDFSGVVSLSSDGIKLAIGAWANDGSYVTAGHVRVFDLSALLATEGVQLNSFKIHPNPVKDVLHIVLKEGIELKQVKIYNVLGQYIESSEYLQIPVGHLRSGIYLVEIESTKGKSAKKLIVE